MNFKYIFVFLAVFVLYYIITTKVLNYFFFAPTAIFNIIISIAIFIILLVLTKITVDKIFE